MSSEDLESLIVSDESLLDPSIDASRLRRTTDTRQELLGDLEPGIKYDPTLQSTYSDLLRYFSGELPIIETPEVITPPVITTPVIDTGGGGQATSDPISDLGGNTNFEQNLIDEGIGLQIAPGQPIFAPGEIPVTQPEIDAFNFPELTEQMSEVSIPTPTTITAPSGDIFAIDDPLAEEKIDIVTEQDTPDTIIEKLKNTLGLDQIDIPTTILKTAINAAVGKPVTLLFDIAQNLLGKSEEEKAAEEAAKQQNIQEAALLTEILQDEVTPQDIIDDRGRGEIPTRTEPEPTPTFEQPRGGGADASQSDFSSGPPSGPGEVSSDAGFSDPSPSRGGGADMGTVDSPVSTAGQAGPPSQRGGGGNGGGSSGGGKIVCTMMNDSYGFGSFRNKIWLRHSKGLSPEYQKGYHKIFLPLVRLSKNNKILKKILEHIAVHRTIDIRQEARGKMHLLGRVYRKILEPICYLVGKYAK